MYVAAIVIPIADRTDCPKYFLISYHDDSDLIKIKNIETGAGTYFPRYSAGEPR